MQQLKGIVPPMVTPLLSQHQLDEQGISRLVAHIVKGGVQGLFVLGTSGEAPSLSYGMRKDLLHQVIAEVDGRIPVLAGITDTSLEESVRFAGISAEAGATAVVAAPPYYFPTSQEALVAYFKALAEEITLPLFIYNIPSHTKVSIEADTVLRLLELPNIAGYKDSTGDMTLFHQMQLKMLGNTEKTYLVGPEELLAETVLMGGHGGVNGGANVFPGLYVRLYEAAVNHRTEDMIRLHRKVIGLSAAVYNMGGRSKSVISGIKAALSTMGICQDTVALPLPTLTAEEKKTIAAYIEKVQAEFINIS